MHNRSPSALYGPLIWFYRKMFYRLYTGYFIYKMLDCIFNWIFHFGWSSTYTNIMYGLNIKMKLSTNYILHNNNRSNYIDCKILQ